MIVLCKLKRRSQNLAIIRDSVSVNNFNSVERQPTKHLVSIENEIMTKQLILFRENKRTGAKNVLKSFLTGCSNESATELAFCVCCSSRSSAYISNVQFNSMEVNLKQAQNKGGLYQCDQMGRHFAALAIFWRCIQYLRKLYTQFGQLFMLLGNQYLL